RVRRQWPAGRGEGSGAVRRVAGGIRGQGLCRGSRRPLTSRLLPGTVPSGAVSRQPVASYVPRHSNNHQAMLLTIVTSLGVSDASRGASLCVASVIIS